MKLKPVHRLLGAGVLLVLREMERRELGKLRAQVAAVRRIHYRAVTDTDRVDYISCAECTDYWPCPTIKALDALEYP